MKFGFYTLGCKVNQFETQALEHLAIQHGHTICSVDADAFIINTCTVTSASDHKNIRALHKIRRENPHAFIAVCGCLSQINPEKIQETGEADLITGTENRQDLITLCEQAVSGKQFHRNNRQNTDFEILPVGVPTGRTRSLLKIEDGCDNFCSYCIIPYARGRVRSLAPDIVLSEALKLQEQGAKEIVVTGIEIASYGKDLSCGSNLLTLISCLCKAIPDIRIRLGSLEPRILTEEFCRSLSVFPNLAHHFHISLQSGCDKTLREMNRKYTTLIVKNAIDLLRIYFPNCSITGDLITGFPGETEEDFGQTLKFIKTCRFSALHVFPYSERSGTVAASRKDQIQLSIRHDRAERAKKVAGELSRSFLENFIGKTINVLLETPQPNYTPAHSSWHFIVKVKKAKGKKNTTCLVKIKKIDGSFLIGEEI